MSIVEFPTTPFQRYTLWAYDQFRTHYPGAGLHWAQAIKFDVVSELRLDAFTKAFHAVVRHHDVFRSTFFKRDGVWACRLADAPNTPVFVADYRGPFDRCQDDVYKDMVSFAHHWDLEEGPLLRAGVFRTDDRTICSVAGHRLVGDLHTGRIIIRDLCMAYGQAVSGEPITLPPVNPTLVDYARRLQAELDATPSDRAVEHMRKCTEASGNQNVPWLPDRAQQRETPDWCFREVQHAKELSAAAKALGVATSDCLDIALEAALAAWAGGPVGYATVYHGRALVLGGRLIRPLRTCGMLEYFVTGLAERRNEKRGIDRIAAARTTRETMRSTALEMFREFERGLVAAGSIESWRKRIPVYVNHTNWSLPEPLPESDAPALYYTTKYEPGFELTSMQYAPKSRLPDFFGPLDIVIWENGEDISISVDAFGHIRPDSAEALREGIQTEVAALLASIA